MPPIQWLKLRQKRLACDRDSTSERILEPVVVKPETVSNQGVYIIWNVAVPHEGDSAENTHNDPAQGDSNKPLPCIHGRGRRFFMCENNP